MPWLKVGMIKLPSIIMYSLNDIKSVQIEITERCNAACPACTRNYFGYGANPGIWTGNMTLDQFKILLPEEFKFTEREQEEITRQRRRKPRRGQRFIMRVSTLRISKLRLSED